MISTLHIGNSCVKCKDTQLMKFLFTHTIGLFYSNITSVQLLKNFFNISLVYSFANNLSELS